MDFLVFSPELIILLSGIAFIAGFVDAIVGGGGLLTMPALLTAGLSPHLVLGTTKLASTCGAVMATNTYYRRKLFTPQKWYRCIIATAIGAAVGAFIAHLLPPNLLDRILPVIVFACAIYFLVSKTPNKTMAENTAIPTTRQYPQGFILGLYDGVAGPGTGAFWMVSTLLLYPVDLIRASGVARSLNCVSNVVALSIFIYHGQGAWLLGGGMGACLMAGAYFGVNTAIKGGTKLIKPIFITVVLLITLRLVWKSWFGGA